jgi:hypothetical protein
MSAKHERGAPSFPPDAGRKGGKQSGHTLVISKRSAQRGVEAPAFCRRFRMSIRLLLMKKQSIRAILGHFRETDATQWENRRKLWKNRELKDRQFISRLKGLYRRASFMVTEGFTSIYFGLGLLPLALAILAGVLLSNELKKTGHANQLAEHLLPEAIGVLLSIPLVNLIVEGALKGREKREQAREKERERREWHFCQQELLRQSLQTAICSVNYFKQCPHDKSEAFCQTQATISK